MKSQSELFKSGFDSAMKATDRMNSEVSNEIKKITDNIKEGGGIDTDKSAKRQFSKDLQNDPDYLDFKKRSKFMDKKVERTFGVPNVAQDDPYIKKKKYSRPGKEENNEATGTGSSGAYSAPLFSGEEPKKVEATEATGSGSVGAYETPAAWAKSTGKKDWRGKSKTQIPGGAFVSVKKRCKTFPYCNQGDIKSLKIYEKKEVKEAISNVARIMNLNETVIKAVIEYELEKRNKL
jgi:hypothetical protein